MSADLTLWLSDQIGHHVGEGDLSKIDALAVTAKIKAYAGVTCLLIAGAHERKAHKALGYSTWEEYVGAEFDISKSRSYQLISQARFVLELSEAVSTIVDVSEWEARELAPHIEEAKAAAKEAEETAPPDATDEEKEERIRAALSGVRSAARAQHDASYSRPEAPENVDPETGEIVEDEGGTSDEPEDEATTTANPDTTPSSSTPKNPALLHRADLSAHQERVGKWLAYDRHHEVIDAMDAQERADYRSFLLSVFNHTSAAMDYIDGANTLRAVK